MTTQRTAAVIARVALGLILPPSLAASRPPHPMTAAAAATMATLQVTNNNAQPVFVVLLDKQPDGWAQWPLGTIEKHSTGVFLINSDVLGLPNIRIVASAFSNWKEYQSAPVTFARGRHMDLTLNNPEPHSLLAAK
jgi:hypothetical protein